jgi:hypothetical protein
MQMAAVFVMALSSFVSGGAAPATAQEEAWANFSGWIVAVGDGYVDARLRGYPMGPTDVVRFALTSETRFETGLAEGAAVIVLAYRRDGEWYAASISAEPQGDEMIHR